MTPRTTSVEARPQVQVNTFYLLWCETCGHAAEPSKPIEQPDFVAPASDFLRCNDCGEGLHLLECFTAPESTMWQARPGATWHHVIYAHNLSRRGRQIWTHR